MSNQARTRHGGVYSGDLSTTWGSPNGYWYTTWLELAWLQMDNCLTGGDLVSSLKGGAVGRDSAQLERISVGRTFGGMGRVANPNAVREVLLGHSSDDAGDNITGGGGMNTMMVIERPNADPSLFCIYPTGSEAKSDRTVKEPEVNKSLNHKDQRGQGDDGFERGNVAPATDSHSIPEHWSTRFKVTQTGKSENKCDRDVEQKVP